MSFNRQMFFAMLLAPTLLHCTANLDKGIMGGDSDREGGGEVTSGTLSIQSTTTNTAVIGQDYFVAVTFTAQVTASCADNIDTGESCVGPHTNVGPAFIASASCDDDLCDVFNYKTNDGSDTATYLRIVPKAKQVTLHVTTQSGAVNAAASLAITATAVPTSDSLNDAPAFLVQR